MDPIRPQGGSLQANGSGTNHPTQVSETWQTLNEGHIPGINIGEQLWLATGVLTKEAIGDANIEKVAKIRDGDEEIICWSGPLKGKRSPVKCDERIGFVEPVMHLPRRAMVTAARPNSKPKDASMLSSMPGALSIDDSTISNGPAQDEVRQKRQRLLEDPRVVSDHVESVHSRRLAFPHEAFKSISVTLNSNPSEEEILCWSGPPKQPRSHVSCDDPIVVTEPMLRITCRTD